MKIDYNKIKTVFPDKAWVYIEQYNTIMIGKWDGNNFKLYDSLEEDYLQLLRVFDSNRELRFSGDKCRDTEIYKTGDYITELADAWYYIYGSQLDAKDKEKRKNQPECDGEFTILREDRGGAIYFPGILQFPNNVMRLKLAIRNFVRYNQVPVLPKGEHYSFGLSNSGTGALEVVDYAYTGFYYEDEDEIRRAVEL